MSNLVIEHWQSYTAVDQQFLILPDGCRDIIYQQPLSQAPQWFITELQLSRKTIASRRGTDFFGLRLKPGVIIKNEQRLIKQLQSQEIDSETLFNCLEDNCEYSSQIDESLRCIAEYPLCVVDCAKQLGVSSRTLQRLVLKHTQQPPSYWLMLARARKCARALSSMDSLAELALEYHFSDQAHMTREFQRLFQATPLQMKKSPELTEQLTAKAFA